MKMVNRLQNAKDKKVVIYQVDITLADTLSMEAVRCIREVEIGLIVKE